MGKLSKENKDKLACNILVRHTREHVGIEKEKLLKLEAKVVNYKVHFNLVDVERVEH